MIKFKSVVKKYKDKKILEISNLELLPGSYVIKGANGSGKSTFVKMLAQKEKYDGSIELGDILLDDIVYVSQDIKLLNKLSIKQNLEIFLNDNQIKKTDILCKRLSFEKVLEENKVVEKLSGGEKQKLQLIIALLKESKILILDEIENNLDEKAIQNVQQVLIENQTMYIFIITHKDLITNGVVDNVLTIEEGQIYLNETNRRKYEINNKSNGESNKKSLSKKEIKYLRKYNNINFILISIILLLIFIVINFLVSTTTLNLSMISRVETTPFADNVSVITAPRYTQDYLMRGNDSWLKTTKYALTKENVDELQNQEYVSSVEYIGPPESTLNIMGVEKEDKILGLPFDYELDLTGLDYEKYNELVNNKISEELNETQKYEIEEYASLPVYFMNLVYPKEYFMSTPMSQGPISKETVFLGQVPEDNTNEVLIDQYLAMYLAQKESVELKDLIGREETLSLNVYDEDFYVLGEAQSSFIISGIYYTSRPGNIYYSYQTDGIAATMNSCHNPTSTIAIESCQFTLVADNSEDGGISPDKEEELYSREPSEYGTTKALFVKTQGKDGEKQLVEYMKSVDPYIEVDNNYTRIHNSNTRGYYNYLFKNSIILLMSFIVFLSIILMLCKLLKIRLSQKVYPILKHYNILETENNKIYVDQKKVIFGILLTITLIFIVLLLIKVRFNLSIYLFLTICIILFFDIIIILFMKLIK